MLMLGARCGPTLVDRDRPPPEAHAVVGGACDWQAEQLRTMSASQNQMSSGPAHRAWETFSPAGLRVLVVDDDKLCLKVIAKMLQQCHYEGK
jgi:PleD family two-component response regulator